MALDININDFIPKHKYIRLYNSEDEYQADVDSHEMHECSYNLLNKDNQVEKLEYQPSHRTTNEDDKKLMPYFNNDNIRLWAGLKIIWGYFGWEEKTIEVDGEELLGGQFYVVKPMTTLKTVPDLWQYQHLRNLLLNVNTVDYYEEQDFSTIKTASYLVKPSSNNKETIIPKCYTDLDQLIYGGSLYINTYSTLNFQTDKIKLNSLKSLAIFIISNPSDKLTHRPIIEVDSCRNLANEAFIYETYYLLEKHNNENEVIDEIKAYANLHNVNVSTHFVYLSFKKNHDINFALNITDKYLSIFDDDVITSGGIYITIKQLITLNIEKILSIEGNGTGLNLESYSNDINIENINLKSNETYNSLDKYISNEIVCNNLIINNFEFNTKNSIEFYIKATEVNIKTINLSTTQNPTDYIFLNFNANNINIENITSSSYNIHGYDHSAIGKKIIPTKLKAVDNIDIKNLNFYGGGEVTFDANNIDVENFKIYALNNDYYNTNTYITIQGKEFNVKQESSFNVANIKVTLALLSEKANIPVDINVDADVFNLFSYNYKDSNTYENEININTINVNVVNPTDGKQTSNLQFIRCIAKNPITIVGAEKLSIEFSNYEVPIIYDSSKLYDLNLTYSYVEKPDKKIIVEDVTNLTNLSLRIDTADYSKDRVINITPTKLESIILNDHINYPDDVEVDESTFIIPTTFTKSLSVISTNIRKDLLFRLDYTSDRTFYIYKTINITTYKGYDNFERNFIVYDDENLNNRNYPMQISLNLNFNNKSFTFKTDNNKELYFDLQINNYNTFEYLDLRNVFICKHKTFNLNKPVNICLKHYIADINYNDLVDELDFDIVHDTILGNLDNPFLGLTNSYDIDYNPKENNILTLNRRLYNKFTDEEKEQLLTCWQTINIRENIEENESE